MIKPLILIVLHANTDLRVNECGLVSIFYCSLCEKYPNLGKELSIAPIGLHKQLLVYYYYIR